MFKRFFWRGTRKVLNDVGLIMAGAGGTQIFLSSEMSAKQLLAAVVALVVGLMLYAAQSVIVVYTESHDESKGE